MKKIIAFSLVCLVVLAIPTVIILQQRANDRRVAAITAHQANMEALLLDNGVLPQDTSRQTGCARTQEKYGPGDKYCGRDLNASQSSLTLSQAQNLVSILQAGIESQPSIAIEQTSNPSFEKKAEKASATSGYLYYNLDDTTHCKLDITYTVHEDELGRKVINDSTQGDLNIRVGCQDNSWWLRTFGG